MKSKNKVTCIVTGEQLGVRPDVYAKRLAKVGGNEEELARTYISRQAKKMLQEGQSVAEIRKHFGIDAGSLPEVPQDILDSIKTKKKVKSRTKTVKVEETNDSEEVDPDIKSFMDLGMANNLATV